MILFPESLEPVEVDYLGEAREIVNYLLEVHSTSLELAHTATRWLYQRHRNLFTREPHAVSRLVFSFLKSRGLSAHLLQGTVRQDGDAVPHAWLSIEGQQFDPAYAVAGPLPQEYQAGPVRLPGVNVYALDKILQDMKRSI
jgi:hypothetical protein